MRHSCADARGPVLDHSSVWARHVHSVPGNPCNHSTFKNLLVFTHGHKPGFFLKNFLQNFQYITKLSRIYTRKKNPKNLPIFKILNEICREINARLNTFLPLIQEEIVEFCILRFWKKGYNFFEIRSWNLDSNLELDIIKRQRVTHSAVRPFR